MDLRFAYILCSVTILRFSHANVIRLAETIESLLSNGSYKGQMRPNLLTGNPDRIRVDMFMDYLGQISESKSEFTVTMFLRQRWYDHRLAFAKFGYNESSFELHSSFYEKLWVPDVYIRNLKNGHFHTLTVPNRLLRIDSDGEVLYSQRLTVTMVCSMELKRFPMDEQICRMTFESYAYTTDSIVIKWNSASNFSYNKNLSQPDFILTTYDLIDCTSVFTTGSYACVEVALHLERRLTVYILSVYIPSCLVVCLSWLSFWIDLESVPARISLSLITILTITTQTFGNTRGLFSTSVLKALDVWMSVCLLLVFAAFLEYALVNTLQRHSKSQNSQEINGDEDKKNIRANGEITSQKSFCSNKALSVDVISRFLFPLIFVLFNIIYWPVYLSEW